MKIKRNYLRELQKFLTREIGMPFHSCSSYMVPPKKCCLICFLARNPKYGLLYSKILLDAKIINIELVREKYLAIANLIGDKRILEIIDSDLNLILKSPTIKCPFCDQVVPSVSKEFTCLCGAKIYKKADSTEAVETPQF